MEQISYGVKLNNMTRCLDPTIRVYRDAVRYLTEITLLHYDEIRLLPSKRTMTFVEKLVHGTKKRTAVYPEFDRRFYKMPSYLRRAAIVTAIGKADSYRKLTDLWKADGCKGKKPFLNLQQDMMPCFYRENMFRHDARGFAIKIFRNNDWVWQTIKLRKTDLDYIAVHCAGLKESAPVLRKRNHGYELRFAYIPERSSKRFVKDENVASVIGVDLGLTTDAVCVSMKRDGTVTGQSFFNSPVEKDRMYTLLGKIRKVQASGNRDPRRLWRFVDNYNLAVAVKTASAIVKYAVERNADVIVFEDLSSLRGRAHGASKQKIGIWRKKDIQKRTEALADRFGIRVVYVNPKNTSRLAYDGSGPVKRGREADFRHDAICRFTNGKIYNCDLSASKNIAARYLIGCFKKSMPETAWLQVSAKVPELCTRTKCTLATLINLSAELAA